LNEESVAGRTLHTRILDQYPSLDPVYRKASLWGALSDRPLVLVWVPKSDWDSLSTDDRSLLSAYAASQIEVVRASPFDFLDIPRTAPLAPTIRRKARGLGPNDWGIGIGPVSADGRDVLADEIAAEGK